MNATDESLEEDLGFLGGLLKPFVPAESIPVLVHDVGSYVSSVYVNTSIVEPVTTPVNTDKGNFMVIGTVSAMKGL
ncbi:hypothetical protein [uncultured Photobacterium sp.]|uniref:hypothetical protein n=1 Tax=uncultured Photobacterium sp. TaxID=173973 RepID=UPI00262AF45E|nr:hypothetical protein [uncultured Photobacterium sp.]